MHTYAEPTDVDVAQRPDGWDGQDLGLIKQVDLRGRMLPSARAAGAFLAKADLEGADLQGADLRYADLQGAVLESVNLRGANLRGADLQGADLGGAGLWRARVDGTPEGDQLWDLAEMSGANVDPVAADIDAWIAQAAEDIASERVKSGVVGRLRAALAESEQPAVPTWSAQPRVWFEEPPEGFDWDAGARAWAERDAYDEELARFLGELACAADGPVLGVARRAVNDPERHLARLLVERILGEDCPPADGLPEAMRSMLEELKERPPDL